MTDHERKIEVRPSQFRENWIVKAVDTRVFADGEVCHTSYLTAN